MYTPTPGFFDISRKPETLDKRAHEKLQEIQMFLVHVQKNAAYYREHNQHQWEKAKQMSGEIQAVILQHWIHDELFEIQEGQLEIAI